jgi:hypothetical protein
LRRIHEKATTLSKKPQEYVQQARYFLREYTQGLNVADLRRLFDQDAAHTYKVLTRDREGEAEPEKRAQRLLYRARVVFLGLSYKLSPPRRLLFVACLLFAVLGLLSPPSFDFTSSQTRIYLDFSPFWFLLSLGGLVWLLAMELVDRVRVRDELEVARKLQSDLLPDTAPDLPGYRFAHSYRTANEVGGDYYDFQPLPDGRLALLVGDVSGHGIAAGLLMAIANATLKTALELDPEPRAVASWLNSTLYRTGDRRAFRTLFYGRLEPTSGELRYICAGHPFPRQIELSASQVTLDRGDLLVLFTDGLPEAVNAPNGEAFGFHRLKVLLQEVATPSKVHDRMLLAFDQHVGHEPLIDDLTLVVMARTTLSDTAQS